LAALEATLTGPVPPVLEALRTDPVALRERTARLAQRLGGRLVPHDGRVGGGGGAEVPLPGWAVALEEELAPPLRTGEPAVVATVRDGDCLLDLRCVPAEEDETLVRAVAAARGVPELQPRRSRSSPPPDTAITATPTSASTHPRRAGATAAMKPVIATAGHGDRGKSTLVRALTGIEPDRWAEERRRGLTIDLGFAWTTLPSGHEVSFVDVPGHERFLGNMLAGL